MKKLKNSQGFAINSGIVGGYSSDSDTESDSKDDSVKRIDENIKNNEFKDEDDKDDDEVQFEIVDDTSSEDGFDLNDLESEDEEESIEIFKILFTKYKLDPFGSWDLESLKLINDPDYLVINDNKKRKSIFDGWCQEHTIPEEEIHESEFARYMKFLQLNCKNDLFIDFKKNNDLQFQLNSKDLEKIYKEFMIFYNKSVDFRISIFTKIILNSKIFKKNIKNVKYEDIKDIKSIHELQSALEIHESLLNNVKYYIIDDDLKIETILKYMKLNK